MCETKIVSSPLGPFASRAALGFGATAGLVVALQMVPAAMLWALGALGVAVLWAAIATIIAIRQRADTAHPAPRATHPARPGPPVRAHAEILATRTRPALETGTGPDTEPSTARDLQATRRRDHRV